MKCQAGIRKEYKRAKSDSVDPWYPDYNKLPVCGGDLTIRLEAADSDWGPAVLDITTHCTRCKRGYHPILEVLNRECDTRELDITPYLKE